MDGRRVEIKLRFRILRRNVDVADTIIVALQPLTRKYLKHRPALNCVFLFKNSLIIKPLTIGCLNLILRSRLN